MQVLTIIYRMLKKNRSYIPYKTRIRDDKEDESAAFGKLLTDR